MPAKNSTNSKEVIFNQTSPQQIKTLINTALGEIKADMVVSNADLVNVYSGELLKGYSVAVKGERIAYVGEKAEHTIGPDTRVIDAIGKTLIPGLIDAHAHIFFRYDLDEFLRYVMKGGTTTIITESRSIIFPLGYQGIEQYLKAIGGQPIKIFVSAPPVPGLGPAAQINALNPESLRRLLEQDGIIGLGESYWSDVVEGDERILRLFAETLSSGKILEGHSAGARGNKLVAYIASGISSCHEPTNVEEVLERLRLGIHTIIRESDIHRNLEAIADIKDEKINFRRLALCTDGIGPKQLVEHGYMEFAVQRAIDLGFDPIVAIQMATLNSAEHFHLDKLIGGIAPGKSADMVLIPDPQTIQAELVISKGQVIAKNGELLVLPRKHVYPESVRKSVHLPRKLKPDDFHIHIEAKETSVTVRVINQVTEFVTREEQIVMTPKEGLLEADVEKDILKAAVIERTNDPGKMFTGLVKGFKMKRGAFASSAAWVLSGIVVIGTNDEDMAGAVNRVFELQGGIVVYDRGNILAELPLPLAGLTSDLPIEEVEQKFKEVQQKATELGAWMPDVDFTLTALTSGSIPFLRMCEAGLIDIKKKEPVDLIV